MIRWLRTLFRRPRWTDSDIEHYERVFRLEEKQRAAREALGDRWVCHPANHVERIPSKPRALRLVSTSNVIHCEFGVPTIVRQAG